MRKDMADVFHDRPTGHRWSNCGKGEKRALQKIDVEDLPKHGPCKKSQYRYHNYTPIRRFLRSKVGEKWNDIYKEFSESCDIRSDSQRGVFESLDYLVERNIQMIDSVPHDSQGKRLLGSSRGLFYVHPEKETLEIFFGIKQANRRKKSKQYIKVDEYRQYHRIKGIWYLLEFKSFNDSKLIINSVTQDILKTSCAACPTKHWDYSNFNLHYRQQMLIDLYGSAIYPVSKHQCNKKEIKKINAEIEKRRKVDQE